MVHQSRMGTNHEDVCDTRPRAALPFPFSSTQSPPADAHLQPDTVLQSLDSPSHNENNIQSLQATPSTLSSTHSPTSLVSPEDIQSSQDKESEPSSGPQRNKKRSAQPSAQGEPEKRKRHRVTPEQLVQLEHWFKYKQSSPNAEERREISQRLGMGERQTQIWFQNRRAKAKQLAQKGIVEPITTPSTIPPVLTPSLEAELQALIHEDKAVTLIPCSDLSVGKWRRIAASGHDLLGYFSESDKMLSWFIQSGGHAFKMEVHWDQILEADFLNVTPGMGHAKFRLKASPSFFLESIVRNYNGKPLRLWRRCADWTEDQQASQIMMHEVTGAAIYLSNLVDLVNAHHVRSSKNLLPQVQIPAPPMASIKTEYAPIAPTNYVQAPIPVPAVAYQPQSTYAGGSQYVTTHTANSYPSSHASRTTYTEVHQLAHVHVNVQYTGTGVAYNSLSPSPPILTTPYHPPNTHEGYNSAY
ncbi:hypothetical protein AX16_004987 [Volvariella volvacea WC 439]|nr:hypothetical protein AX16_004987 [Volvariella volvacea WC 439]